MIPWETQRSPTAASQCPRKKLTIRLKRESN
jgi:hypothetical protein